MMTRGKHFHKAFVQTIGSVVSCVPKVWEALFGDWQDGFDQAAAEYDKATRAELPADVEAFVAECETLCKQPLSVGEGNEVIYERVPRLCAIVREHGHELCQAGQFEQTAVAATQELGELNAKLNEENDTLREHLAKLEAAAWIVVRNADRMPGLRVDPYSSWIVASIDSMRALLNDSAKAEPLSDEQPKPVPPAEEDIGSCAWWARNYLRKVKELPKCCDRAGQAGAHCPVRCACHG